MPLLTYSSTCPSIASAPVVDQNKQWNFYTFCRLTVTFAAWRRSGAQATGAVARASSLGLRASPIGDEWRLAETDRVIQGQRRARCGAPGGEAEKEALVMARAICVAVAMVLSFLIPFPSFPPSAHWAGRVEKKVGPSSLDSGSKADSVIRQRVSNSMLGLYS